MKPLLHDARIACRFLRRNPGFTLAATSVLALGIALSTMLFAIVEGALLEPWPYRGADRLVTVRGNYPAQGRADFSLWSVPEIEDLRRVDGVFQDVIAGDARNVTLLYSGRPERVRAAVVTPNAFEMLGVPAFMGRALDSTDAVATASPAVVVNYRFWRNRLGADPHVIGRLLRARDEVYTIVGVMPERFVFWDRDLWMPLRLDPGDARTNRRYYVQARLQPGLGLKEAQSRLGAVAARLAADHPERQEYVGLSVSLNFLVEDVLRDLRPTLYLLVAAVALVLIVSMANLANATLARGMAREGELAIRRAIGGSAAQIARQLLVESAVIGVAGGAVGAVGASALLPGVLSLIPFGYIPAEAHVAIEWRLLGLATLFAVGCSLLIGLMPALRAAAIDPATLLKQHNARTGSTRAHRWRDGFVVAQLTLAIVVLGVAASAAVSLRHAIRHDPGYRASDVWTARIALPSAESAGAAGAALYDRILVRLRSHPSIADAVVASAFPVGPLPTTLVSAETSGAAQRLATRDAATLVVSPGFFHLLAIPVVDGRVFTDADTLRERPVVVATRGLARRLWPDGRGVGSRLTVGIGDATVAATVVGIVGDVDSQGGEQRVQPAIFFPIAQRAPATAVIGLKTSDRRDALAIVDEVIGSVSPGTPVFEPEMLEQARLTVLGPRLLAVALLGVFGLTVLALSSVGIYAVVSQRMQERARELQIRLTFGAEPWRLFTGELARAGRLVLTSVVGGSALALAALRVLSESFTGFGGSPAAALAMSTALLGGLAITATALPAWSACQRRALGAHTNAG